MVGLSLMVVGGCFVGIVILVILGCILLGEEKEDKESIRFKRFMDKYQEHMSEK